jgi:hypothetical protein
MSNEIKTTANATTNTDTAMLTYKFGAYDSQLPIACPENQRIVKCLYKENPKTKKKAGENSYICIPTAHMAEKVVIENAAKLAPYVVNFLQATEDSIIKEAHKTGSLGFTDVYFSLDKVLAYLDEAGQGSRLNKEKIEDWFKASMRDKLIEAFAAKLGVNAEEPTAEELEKLATITNAYQAKFASLASGKTFYRPEECELLQKALEVTQVAIGNSIGEQFYSRLDKMKEKPESNDLLSLL